MKRCLTWLAATLIGMLPTGCGSDPDPVPQSAAPASFAGLETAEAPTGEREKAGSSSGDAAPTWTDANRIVTPDQMIDALRRLNPGFDGVNIGMRPISADLLEMAINDPAVKDISPLRKQRIAKLDLRFCDVTDLRPLEGMPISELYLEDNKRLSDLGPLRGMPLHKLYVAHTAVENLAPLRGAPLMELNAVGARIKDLSPLTESPLQMLWLTDCPVQDLSPLKKVPLVSLTLENTPVEEIGPLAGSTLQRLHIGGTRVKDLTPVGQLRLSRLIFTPSRIERGLDVVRNCESIREIGSDFEQRMAPDEFWQLFDEGRWKPQ